MTPQLLSVKKGDIYIISKSKDRIFCCEGFVLMSCHVLYVRGHMIRNEIYLGGQIIEQDKDDGGYQIDGLIKDGC